MRIIIIDDEPTLLDLFALQIKEALADAPCQIYSASNGKEGLDLLKTVPEDEVLCMVTDHEMPVMGGDQFCKEIRCIYKKAPIFLHTATYADELSRLRQESAGLDVTVLSKMDSMQGTILPWIRQQAAALSQ